MRAGDIVLMVVFAIVTGWLITPYVAFPWALGGDARIYTQAAEIWLDGGNPWGPLARAAVTFAGPPHSLLFFAPFVSVPQVVTGTVWAIGLLVVSIFALRRLGLPLWWLLFPPLSNAILVGSLDALAFSLLVLGGGWLAPIAKPYAAFGLLAERRLRDLLVAAVIGAVLLLILPWQRFLENLDGISASLARHAEDLSSFGEPVGMVIAVVALVSLGWRRGLWLAAPVLWPATQLHYAAVSLPGLTRASALFFALPIPGAPLVGVVLAAVLARVAPNLDPPILSDPPKRRPGSTAAARELAGAR
jgi:hypothetical protein